MRKYDLDRTLFVSDLDGTLLNSNAELSRYTIDRLNHLIDNGMNFTIATARSAATVKKILKELYIKHPVILMNGVLIYDLDKEIYIKKETVKTDKVIKIIDTLKKHKMTGFMYSVIDNELWTYYESLQSKSLQDFHDERVKKYYKTFIKVDDFKSVIDKEIVYFALLDEFDKLNGIYHELSKIMDLDLAFYKDIYSRDLWYLEIHSINGSKFNAIKHLRDNSKFNKIIGFGDNLNDIPLFKACDECYAVGNAKKELKEIASGILLCNEEDGVVKWLDNII